MGLSVSGVGRGATLSPLAPGEVTSEGARVEIRRPAFVEWYENSPAGLEQGFTLSERPGGEGPLAIELALSGASASMRGEEMLFTTEGERRLRYGALSAVDGAGRKLVARMELSREGRVRLEVEDANADGYADIIMGAYLFDAGQTDEGAAFVFLGSASGIADGSPATAAAQLESDQSFGPNFGLSVAGAGDVNGDGYSDVIVGADNYDAGQAYEGAAYVFLGNSAGRPVRAGQRRGDAFDLPVQPWGGAGGTGVFNAELVASHPDGTGRVKAEFDVCPTGVPFGHASCTNTTTSSWVSVDGESPEVLLAQSLSTSPPNALYRWRARVRHAPATGTPSAKPAHGPWRRVNAQAVEADIRTVPEPSTVVGIGSSIALLFGLKRRRRPGMS